jgi:hypothetical protein
MTQQDREEFTSLKIDVENIKINVNETKQNSERLNKEFDKLMFHLVGDKETNTKGLIEDFRTVKLRLNRVEKFYVVVAGIIGFIISYITKKFM